LTVLSLMQFLLTRTWDPCSLQVPKRAAESVENRHVPTVANDSYRAVLTLHHRLPTLSIQALGPRILHGIGDEGGGLIQVPSSRLQVATACPDSTRKYNPY